MQVCAERGLRGGFSFSGVCVVMKPCVQISAGVVNSLCSNATPLYSHLGEGFACSTVAGYAAGGGWKIVTG